PPAAAEVSPDGVISRAQDDFYLNLVDWSPGNILAVGLNCSVYLWSAESGSVSHTRYTGLVHIYDALRRKRVRVMQGHTQRVGNLAWNNDVLTSGSRDRHIIHRDTRAAQAPIATLTAHRQEICGLKWDVAHNKLASGGNDNKLIVWDGVRTDPLHLFDQHTAAVKAIAWSPHQKGILASGGGTADKHIRLWNTTVGTALSAHDTGSQVGFPRNGNELVSTHGYSQNEVVVWKAQKMAQVATLTGHSSRVLYLAMSPDGQTIVTGAGDETLRFW
ncbi:MAG: WD40-repeat-containing domain protein, partial [Olpidium bornovanus]